MKEDLLSVNRKAFEINQNPKIYGTFAEIGAGQEVARFFFQAGQASNTVAKTMSAYDMTFSDAIYGKGERYVSLTRLKNMLKHEYDLLQKRLKNKRGKNTCFFTFANTVTTSHRLNTEINSISSESSNFSSCHGWIGIRFQTKPKGPSNDILLHIRMLDRFRLQQQEALGILGVNLIYSAFYLKKKEEEFIPSLVDNLHKKRIEIDYIQFKGKDLKKVHNRLINLELVQHSLTKAILFKPKKRNEEELLQLSESLHKKPLLLVKETSESSIENSIKLLKKAKKRFEALERKSLKPSTDSLSSSSTTSTTATSKTLTSPREPLLLVEIYIKPFSQFKNQKVLHNKLLRHIEKINALNIHVLISSFPFHFLLKEHLRQYTDNIIIFIVNSSQLNKIFNEKSYLYKDGSKKIKFNILKALGHLFDDKFFFYTYSLQQMNQVKNQQNKLKSKNFSQKELKEFFLEEPSLKSYSFISKSKLKNLFLYFLENKKILQL